MLEITSYLQEYSGAIQAISTIVLVIVTIFYAIQTRLTVKKMGESKKMEFLPIISISKLFFSEGQHNMERISLGHIRFKNEGRGVARKVQIFFPFDKTDKCESISVKDDELESMFVFDLQQKILELPIEKRYIKIEYYDIFNRLIITKALIEEIEERPGYKELGITSWELILPE